MKTQSEGARPREENPEQYTVARGSGQLDPVVKDIARLAAQAVIDQKGGRVVVLDVSGRTSYCDVLVLTTGSQARHVQAIADAVVKAYKQGRNERPLGVEGTASGRWVLVDLGDVIVHAFDGPMRGYYDLDGLWVDARVVPFSELDLEAPGTDEAGDDDAWPEDDEG